jgi:hypothetical protein
MGLPTNKKIGILKRKNVLYEIKSGTCFLSFLGGWFLVVPPKDAFTQQSKTFRHLVLLSKCFVTAMV